MIGLILGYSNKVGLLNQNQSLLLATGFCGGFTTFSTFAYENYLFIRQTDYYTMVPYLAATFILGIAAVFAGMYLISLL
jgi:CrcB protein